MDNFLAIVVTTILILVTIFLVFRELNSWYWKINERIDLQKEEKKILDNILKELKKQNKKYDVVNEEILDSKKEIQEMGIIVTQDPNGEHGLMCSSKDLGKASWLDAKKLCENFKEGGFSNWRLPDKTELQLMYFHLHKNNKGNFSQNLYWTITEHDDSKIWVQDFASGDKNQHSGSDNSPSVRAVRSF